MIESTEKMAMMFFTETTVTIPFTVAKAMMISTAEKMMILFTAMTVMT